MKVKNTAKVLDSCYAMSGKSQFSIVVKRIIGSNKVIADVTEIAHGKPTTDRIAQQLAGRAVRKFGVSSMDCVKLCGHEFTKKCYNLDNGESEVRIRHFAFVYTDVDMTSAIHHG